MRVLPIVVFVCFTLGCGTVSNQSKAAPSQGAIADSWTLTGKCQAVLNWVTRLQDEYPNTAPLRFTPDHPGVANLLRSKYFLPVYGVTYSFKNAPTLKTISHDVLYQCYGLGTFRTFANQLQHYKVLFDNIFVIRLQGQGRGKNLPEVVSNLETVQTAMEEDLKKVSDLPAQEKSFAEIEDGLREGASKFKVLWPSEHKAYVSAMTESKNTLARALLDALSVEIDRMSPSPANVRRIKKEMLPNVTRYEAAQGNREGSPTSQKVNQKLESMVNQLVQERVTLLQSVPDSEAGLKPSEEWGRKFEEEMSDFREFRSVSDALALLAKRRDAMYRTAKPGFLFTLNALDAKQDNLGKADSLLQQSFALPNDLGLPVYEEYAKAVRVKKDQIITALANKKVEELRGFPSTMHSAVAILQWRKDFEHQYGSLKAHGQILAIFNEYDAKRQQILQGAKREFVERQKGLPRSQVGIQQSTEMLDSLFPDLEDEQLPVYAEYKKIVLNRIAFLRGDTSDDAHEPVVQVPSKQTSQGKNGDDCNSGLGKFFTDVFRPYYQQSTAKQHELAELSDEERQKLAAAIDRIESQTIRKYDSIQLYGDKLSDKDKDTLRQLIDKFSAEALMTPEDIEIKALQELQTMKETRLPPTPAAKYAWALKFRKSALTDQKTKEEWPALTHKLPKYPTVRQDVLLYFDDVCRILRPKR